MAKRRDAKKQPSSSESPTTARSARRRLGRGLSSLISSPVPITPTRTESTAPPPGSDAAGRDPGSAEPPLGSESVQPPRDESKPRPAADGDLQMVPIEAVHPNRHQPRQQFDESGLQSLAASIRTAGVMQPIILRPRDNNIDFSTYELVAGERRWRAAKLAGLDRVPAIVRTIDDATAAEWALIENIQREDLNPIERAEAFRRLCDDFSLTHQEIADRVGLDRSSVTNLLRLLDLDDETLDEVRGGHLTLGHARALLSITNISARRALVKQAIRQAWSVRTLERRIKAHGSNEARGATSSGDEAGLSSTQIHLRHLADELGSHLGTRVRIETGRKKGAGKLIIDFYSLDEFESLLHRLGYNAT